tara:strand:- start:1847 stop:3046 length:1200 start_codon:yes stop_codon:yes gene_type:complete
MPILKTIPNSSKKIENNVVPFSGNGYTTVSGDNLTFTAIQRSPDNGRPFSNLYSSFKLPVTSNSGNTWPSIPNNSYFSGLNQSQAIVVKIGKNTYGELIDGRTIHLAIPTGYTEAGGSIDIYSSYINEANWSSDNHPYAAGFGHSLNPTSADVAKPSTNVAFLFSDSVTNNNGKYATPTNSCCSNWSDGFPTTWAYGAGTEPSDPPVGYENGNTSYYNMGINASTRKPPVNITESGDKPVGIAYLDKGFLVLTDPEIVQWFLFSGASSGATGYPYGSQGVGFSTGMTQVTFTSSTSARCEFFTFEKEWLLSVDCVANNGEFFVTENVTASPELQNGAGGGVTPVPGVYSLTGGTQDYSSYITEVGLYDSQDNLVGIAKPDRPIAKAANTTQTFTLKFKY